MNFILGPLGSKQIDRFSLIFVDFRSFARFLKIFIEVLKIAENIEKQSFTFFAFLPPYIGVSGPLVSRMRKSVKRSIDWYQKFLISWLADRYWAVSVFLVRIS